MEPEISQDTLFGLLSHGQRRLLLDCLAERGGPVTLPDAAEQVVSAARGDPIADLDPEAVQRTYLELYHTHVPKLVDAGVVRYSQEDDVIALTDTGDEVVGRLDRFRP